MILSVCTNFNFFIFFLIFYYVYTPYFLPYGTTLSMYCKYKFKLNQYIVLFLMLPIENMTNKPNLYTGWIVHPN